MSLFSQSQKPRNTRIIIFDFDGVLADSLNTFYPLIRDGMMKVGLSLTLKQYRNFFIGNVHQSFKDFINDKEKYASFIEFRKTNYNKYYYDKNIGVKLYPGVLDLIKKASEKYVLAVASSGKKENIDELLKKNGMKNRFGLILADSAYTKKDMIKKILDTFMAKPREAIMITDTVGDILTAKKMGLKTIAVTWGFHSKKLLNSTKPNDIVQSITKLKKLILYCQY